MAYNTAPSSVWYDRKRFAWLLGAIVPVLPFAAGFDVYLTGWTIFWWLGPLFVFGFIPLMDWAFGSDSANPPDSIIHQLEDDRYYRWLTYLFIPFQYVALVWSCWIWSTSELDLFSAIGLAATNGVVAGIAINTAHELGHKSDAAERWMSKIALAQTLYGHFFVEHNRGHHVRVSTPEDPASARLGESFWAFLPRTVYGSLISAWELESERLKRGNKPVWSLRHNEILQAWGISAVLFGALVLAFGRIVLPFLIIQAVKGFMLLEAVNYLEHYGLLRQKKADGRYERCEPRHSWNSNILASNVFLYHLQRHSDHHANPMRRYQALRHFDEAPELPYGYATMILIAIFPPLWFRVMDPKVKAHYGGDLSKANVLNSKRLDYGLSAV